MFKRANHLAKDSIKFVFENLPVLKDHLIRVFPAFLIFALINHYAVLYQVGWLVLAIMIPMGYLVSCFFLSWHRVALRGPQEKPFNPLYFSGESGRFHLIFCVIFLCLGALNHALKYLNENQSFVENNLVLSTLFIIGSVVSFYVLFRIMFLLPAQSVGVTLSFRDVFRCSRGQVGPFVLATIFFGFVVILALTIYSVIMSSINMFVIDNQEISKNQVAIFSFLFSVPVYLALFIYSAIEVTALSKLYQHGMQNNS